MLDASGIIHIKNNQYLVAEDELDVLRFFTLDTDNHLLKATGDEIQLGRYESDFESLAYDEQSNTIYCIGSHSSDTSQKLTGFNLTDRVVQTIPFDASKLFNDVNIESLTVWKSNLFMGYRSPNCNHLAVAVVYVPETATQLMATFDLDGRVFRDLTRIDDENYLILAGPERGKHYKKLPSRLYWWNGDLFRPEVKKINLDLEGVRAEGVAARLHETGMIEVLIGSDESKNKSIDIFRMLYLKANSINELLTKEHQYTELTVEL